MKVITEPTVEVIAKTEFIGSKTFLIPPDGDDFIKTCAFSAKVCYDSAGVDGRANETNAKTILESKHGSVLEHATISLYITGVTRGLTLELNRHRSFNISQRSTRYTAEEDSYIVLEPYYAELWNKYQPYIYSFSDEWTCERLYAASNGEVSYYEAETICSFLNSANASLKTYRQQIELLEFYNLTPEFKGTELRKWCRGKARNLLPHALESRGVWTNNLRGWRHVIELRSERHAEAEIRRLSHVILEELRKHAPFYFADFENNGVYNGIIEWVPKLGRV